MKRNPFFDNAKFFLIFLVVFGHMIQPYIDDVKEINTLYYFIYFFHMPAFVFISGFFAKGLWDKKYIINLAKKLFLPYIMFQIFYSIYYVLIGVSDWQFSLITPRWSLWYLISLFCWHILLIIFKTLSPRLSIVIAICIGLLIGYMEPVGHTLSLSRTFVFFPFFLLGYWLKFDHLKKLKTKTMKVISLSIMSITFVLLFFTPSFSINWLLGSTSYHSLGFSDIGGIIRFGIYVISFIMMFCFFTFVPVEKKSFTSLGENTLHVYLLHGIFIQYFRVSNFFNVTVFSDVIILALISMMIIIVLSSKYARIFAQPLIELRWSLLKKQLEKIRGSILSSRIEV